jgi:hypothetical protein
MEERASDWRKEAILWRNNHAQIVAIKRGTDARLKTALTALQRIYDMSRCEPKLAAVGKLASDAFERATTDIHDFTQHD